MGVSGIVALAVFAIHSRTEHATAQTVPPPNADGSYTVPHDWALKPSAISPGNKFRILFITSAKRNAAPSNIAPYNTFVQQSAATDDSHPAIKPYADQFKVVGCTTSVDARDNTDTNVNTDGAGEPIYWLDGEKVADDYADFYDGSWDSGDGKTETGGDTSTFVAWTGCINNGTKHSSQHLGERNVRQGITAVNSPLNIGSILGSPNSRPLFALSPVFLVEAIDLTATAQTELTATAQAEMTATAQARLTATAQARLTATAQARLTATAQAGLTATAQAGLTATAQAGLTATAQAGLTATAQAGLTATAQAGLTATAQAELTPTATNTPTPVNTATNTPTPVNTATNTPTPVNTATNTPTPVNTATNTPTPVNTATNTPTPVNTATNTPTPVNTATNTPVPTNTPTSTPGNDLTATVLAMTPSPTPTATVTVSPTAMPTVSVTPTMLVSNTPLPTGRLLIGRLVPTIRSVTLSSHDSVRLSVDIYGRQDIRDQSLGEEVSFEWRENGRLISNSGESYMILYTAPSSPGEYTVTASLDASECLSATECTATFKISVRRASQTSAPPTSEPMNPVGDIPSILVDPQGQQYEVFTPVEGGYFTDGVVTLTAGPGAVPNGEIVGLRSDDFGAASNTGMTHQRYTLAGNSYNISAVDATGNMVADYRFSYPLQFCVPLPNALRSDISNIAMLVRNTDRTLTALSTSVQIGANGVTVCANISSVPASVALGAAGAPDAIPTPTVAPTPETPYTGGTAPSSTSGLAWLILIGIAVILIGITISSRRRSSSVINPSDHA